MKAFCRYGDLAANAPRGMHDVPTILAR